MAGTLGKSSTRIASIDVLRGLTILGMTMCAYIGWNSNLPAWMFHAQTPPPTYEFRPDVPGLTWVDLVFPFFLFSMGAAFPFALKKKLDRGTGKHVLALGLFKRWLILTAFSLVLGNSITVRWSGIPAVWQELFIIGVWGAMFMSLTRFPTKRAWKRNIFNIIGLGLLTLLAGIKHDFINGNFSLTNCDIIMSILAAVSLFGGIIWLLTAGSMKLRILVFLFIAAIKAVASFTPIFDSITFTGWPLFDISYLQYLLIALPGSMVGDILLKSSKETEPENTPGRMAGTAAAIICIAALVFQLWGIQTRHVLLTLCVTSGILAVFCLIIRRNTCTWTRIATIGFAFMIAGIALDFADGGMTKDYCNLSYLFETCGMAALTAAVFHFFDKEYGCRFPLMSGCGQNPMIAYTAASYIIVPILSLTGLMGLLTGAAAGSQFWGVAQGVIITLLLALFTNIFTKAKLFWRS